MTLRCQPYEIAWSKELLRESAKLPEAQKLFQISKLYNLPINDDRILSMTLEQVELLWHMMVVDNPKLEENTVIYDEDYEDVQKQAEEEDKDYQEEDWQEIT